MSVLEKNKYGDTVHYEFINWSDHYWIKKNNVKYTVSRNRDNGTYTLIFEKTNMKPYELRKNGVFYTRWENCGIEPFDSKDDAWEYIYKCIRGEIDIWEIAKAYRDKEEDAKRLREETITFNQKYREDNFPKYLESQGLTQDKFEEILKVYFLDNKEFRDFWESQNK